VKPDALQHQIDYLRFRAAWTPNIEGQFVKIVERPNERGNPLTPGAVNS
jgi:hypothetical protein